VTEAYASPGQALVSATVLGLPEETEVVLEAAVRAQLTGWFGRLTAEWTHLRTCRIRWAQPDQTRPTQPPDGHPTPVAPGIYLAGDHLENASIRRPAERAPHRRVAPGLRVVARAPHRRLPRFSLQPVASLQVII
jgi:hypothetical protein